VRHVPLVAALAWAAILFTVSSFPYPPGTSGGEWKSQLAHTGEYAILGALILIALRRYRPSTPLAAIALTAWAMATLYGMSDEFHQSFVPNRDANWLDVGFDTMGAAVGIAIAIALQRFALPGSRQRRKANG
jgi:VanZ family protein